ncbi:MAG: ice-binding family protein [Mucilaginibacter sp.]
MSKKLNFIRNTTQVCQTPGFLKLSTTIFSVVLLLFVCTTACNKGTSNPAPDPALSANLANNASMSAANSFVIPAPINLRSAGSFTILTETGISTTGVTSIIGDIGVSPIAATAITGFGLIKDASNQFSHTPIVIGKVYAANYAAPTPTKMTTAVSDMRTAFTTANGIVFPAPKVQMYAGDISGRTLHPGLYKWSTGVLITNVGVTLSGGPNDVWIFQIAQNLTVNNSAIITLAGGAQAKNIFWIVSGKASLGTTVNFSGNILSKTLISLNTGACVKGKLLAQTAVTLIANSVHP